MNYFCRQTSQIFSNSLDKKLTTMENLRLRFHWLMCRACRQGAKDMSIIHQILKQPKAYTLAEEKRRIILNVLKHSKE